MTNRWACLAVACLATLLLSLDLTVLHLALPRLDLTSLATFKDGLDHWRQAVYNPIRPHESLGDLPPITRWRPSLRPRPASLPEVTYPGGSVLRRVGSNGMFEYRRARILAGQGLAGQAVRIEETDGCLVVFYTTKEIRRVRLEGLKKPGIV